MTLIGQSQADKIERTVEDVEDQVALGNRIVGGRTPLIDDYVKQQVPDRRYTQDEFSQRELQILSGLIAIELASRVSRDPFREMLEHLQSKLQRLQGFGKSELTPEPEPTKQVS